MIQSFADKRTEQVFHGKCPKGFPASIFRRAEMKLDRLQAAEALDDLRIPPSNRLEALSGNRAGEHSIRINAQWRICFRWQEGHAHEVKITDYH